MIERYEAYKDSRVEWLDEIPVGWGIVSLKWKSHIYAGGTPDKDQSEYWLDGTIPWLNSGAVNQFVITEPSDFITEEGFRNSSAKWIEKESIVVALAGQGKTKGMAAIATFRTTCNQSLSAIQPASDIDSKYLLYYLRANYLNIRGLAGEGKRDGLNLEMIGGIPISVPPLDEQTAIVNFLNHKTAEIDALIAQKERLLELYEEEKTAIINHAVTKGIDTSAELKDSGIDWLGEIPVGWEIKKLKYGVSKVGSGVTPRGGASTYRLSGIPLLRSQNIHVDGIKMDDVAYIDEKLHDSMCNSKVQVGDVLLNITGASIGRCFYADENLGEANVNQHVCIIRPDDKIKTSYLYFILRSDLGETQINIEQSGCGREGLNFEALKNFVIPYFSVVEQTAIVNFLERKTTEIDAKITKTQRIIELQKEYRTALISEVVTGKIIVPELSTQETSV